MDVSYGNLLLIFGVNRFDATKSLLGEGIPEFRETIFIDGEMVCLYCGIFSSMGGASIMNGNLFGGVL